MKNEAGNIGEEWRLRDCSKKTITCKTSENKRLVLEKKIW